MKRIISVLISAIILCSFIGCFNVNAKTPDGYVIVSFEDYGVRLQKDINEGSVDFIKPMEIIVPETVVEYYKGDNVAAVTVRALNKAGISLSYEGTVSDSFYLAAIKNFTNKYYGKVSSFGEFDAGPASGWMVKHNNKFIDRSASAVSVENGDYINWAYSCQIGADIGCDWSRQSAKITGLKFYTENVTLSPSFSNNVKNYELRMPEGSKSVCLVALAENYWSEVTYKVGSKKYKYRSDIPVSNGTVIVIESKFVPEYGKPATDTDKITLTVKTGESSVTLNKSSIVLKYKQSETLKAELTGSKKVTWVSSDPKVASVDQSGKVIAAGRGKAVITAQNEKGDTAQCTVDVKYSFAQWLIIIVLFGWIWY